MKRLILGILILAILLALGIIVSAVFCMIHEPTAQLLEDASKASLTENWKQATALTDQARQRWQDHWHFTATFADHAPMEEIDSLFAQLEVFAAEKNNQQFPALCARLSELTQAIADIHAFRWWTLL